MQLSLESIKNNIDTIKTKTIDIVLRTVNHPDSQYLEPKDLKTLTDVVLNIEDSLNSSVDEGQQARKIQRVLDKYNSPEYLEHSSIVDFNTQPIGLGSSYDQ